MNAEYSKEAVSVKGFQPLRANSHGMIAPELNKV
jgi:hypothetical protein